MIINFTIIMVIIVYYDKYKIIVLITYYKKYKIIIMQYKVIKKSQYMVRKI